MNLQTEAVDCLICEKDHARPFLSAQGSVGTHVQEFTIVKCQDCGLTYVNPRPTLNEVLKTYDHVVRENVRIVPIPEGDLKRTEKRLKRLKNPLAQAVLHQFKNYPTQQSIPLWAQLLAPFACPFVARQIPRYLGQGRVLDIGCNNGLFLYMLKQLGWTVQGVEVDRVMAEGARSLSIDVICSPAEQVDFKESSFDLVRIYEVLEHLHYPLDVLTRVKRWLHPKGELLIRVPNVNSANVRWFGGLAYGAPGHLYGYSVDTLSALLKRVGFKKTSVLHHASKGAFSRGMAVWAKKGNQFHHRIMNYLSQSRSFRRFALAPMCQVLDWIGCGSNIEITFILNS
jgi:2-polyprenyl-3-methyl-5-hydroxy-6-metoxy-1,4-benzoquinol methylase